MTLGCTLALTAIDPNRICVGHRDREGREVVRDVGSNGVAAMLMHEQCGLSDDEELTIRSRNLLLSEHMDS